MSKACFILSLLIKNINLPAYCTMYIFLQEFIFCTVWTVFYLLAASLAADYARYTEAFGVAAVSVVLYIS